LLTYCQNEDINKSKITKAQLGRLVFFDKNLSNPTGQSCSSCHSQSNAFSDPNHSTVSPGISKGLFGNRNAPPVSYAMFAPALHYDTNEKTYIGGQFWDGRANSLEEQAKMPFFNHL